VTGTGSEQTRLVILRGASGSGKSSTARAVRERWGRGVAWVEQDYLRRILLREHDVPGGVNIGLIDATVRHCLDAGYHVLLDGILPSDRYSPMLSGLVADHRGRTCCYYFDVSFTETVRRHAGRPQAAHFTPEEMRAWYQDRDLLPGGIEVLIPQEQDQARTVDLVLENAVGIRSTRGLDCQPGANGGAATT
jgi:adenylate kinase family enzyme